jgi:hypothetical protein
MYCGNYFSKGCFFCIHRCAPGRAKRGRVWEHGEPDKPYKVIGIIAQSKSSDLGKNLLFGSYSQKLITGIVIREKGHGVIVMSSKRFISGYTTDMPMTQYGTATTSPEYSKVSTLAVFRYVETENDSN